MNPGVYENMDGADYAFTREWLSVKKLKKHLPDVYKISEPTDRSNLDFGSALHMMVLGAGDEIVPIDYASWQGKDARERRDVAYDAGFIPILAKEIPRLEATADALKTHPVASELLYGAGRSEVSVFAEVDGVKCKARFDRLTSSGVGVDLKTFSGLPSPHAITRAVLDYGYDMQADHYWRVASAAGVELESFQFVFVGKEPPYFVNVVDLDATFYERADVLRQVALDRINHPDMVDAYPGASGRLTLSAPRWARLD